MPAGLNIPGHLISEIRKSLGDTNAACAARLGVSQASLSRYRNSKSLPSGSVVFRLYQSATNPVHRAAIRAVVGSICDQSANEINSQMVAATALQDRFKSLCLDVSRCGDIPLWMLSLMELWLESKDNLSLRRECEEMIAAMKRSVKDFKQGDLL